MDIDDFKKYNDTYGHLQGNKVLVNLADIILKIVRKNDTAYRYGGEEFVIILPETGVQEAVSVAERIRTLFASTDQCTEDDTHVFKTVSVGVTEYIPGEKSARLIERVDQKMYVAKVQGKNRIMI
jgi:diguanylate cyclase (GGDEF)-like protein